MGYLPYQLVNAGFQPYQKCPCLWPYWGTSRCFFTISPFSNKKNPTFQFLTCNPDGKPFIFQTAGTAALNFWNKPTRAHGIRSHPRTQRLRLQDWDLSNLTNGTTYKLCTVPWHRKSHFEFFLGVLSAAKNRRPGFQEMRAFTVYHGPPQNPTLLFRGFCGKYHGF